MAHLAKCRWAEGSVPTSLREHAAEDAAAPLRLAVLDNQVPAPEIQGVACMTGGRDVSRGTAARVPGSPPAGTATGPDPTREAMGLGSRGRRPGRIDGGWRVRT